MAARRRGRPTADDPSTITTELVLDRALASFAERGYGGTSVRELARELGVSHNLIPQRIGSKEQLWYAAVDQGFNTLAAALADAAVTQEGGDDLVRLRALVERFIEANAARPSLLRLINQEATAPGPRLDHLFDRYIDPVREFGQGLLARLQAEGRVRTGSVALVYFLMTHGAGGPAALPALAERFGAAIDPDDPVAVRRHAVAVTDLLFDGLVLP